MPLFSATMDGYTRGLNNEYWPALYFADAKGKIRHSQFGEGAYEQSEAIRRQRHFDIPRAAGGV